MPGADGQAGVLRLDIPGNSSSRNDALSMMSVEPTAIAQLSCAGCRLAAVCHLIMRVTTKSPQLSGLLSFRCAGYAVQEQ